MRIVGLCGKMGAGKTTVAHRVQGKYGLESLSFVDALILPILKERDLEVNRRNLQQIGRELYLQRGDIALTDTLLSHVDETRMWVVDDIRYASTAQHIRARLQSGFYLIAVVANLEARYVRVKERRREHISSRAEFEQLDSAPTESQIDSVVDVADVVIQNDGSLIELHQRCDEIMKQLLKNWGASQS